MVKSFIISLLLAVSLTGCGFVLRGTQSPIAPTHQSLDIIFGDNAEAHSLKPHLIKTLQRQGVTVETANNRLTLKNIEYRRYELVGILTEVRLVLSAEVEYQLGERMYLYPVRAEHSYQHNDASVASDLQGERAKTWLYQQLAEQIAEQYHSLAQPTLAQPTLVQ